MFVRENLWTIDCCYDRRATLNPDVSGQTVYFLLFQWFEFEERGDIFVKGKDNMKVFLFTKQKESALRMFWTGRIIISELSQIERRCPKNGAPQIFLKIVFLTNKAVLSPYCECEGQKDAIHELWKGCLWYYVIKQKKIFLKIFSHKRKVPWEYSEYKTGGFWALKCSTWRVTRTCSYCQRHSAVTSVSQRPKRG